MAKSAKQRALEDRLFIQEIITELERNGYIRGGKAQTMLHDWSPTRTEGVTPMHYATLIPEPRRRRHRPLSDRQRHILDVVYACTGEQGYPPTLTELADFLGCATATAQGHVDRLIGKGCLTRGGEGRRTLQTIDAEYMETNGPIAAAFLSDVELLKEVNRRGYTYQVTSRRATVAERARRRKD